MLRVPRSTPMRKPNVLVVDDKPGNLLALVAVLAGLLIGLVAVTIVGSWLTQARAFTVTPHVTPELLWIGIVALLVATLAALLPAWRAGRMDVAQTLARG